MGAKTWMLVYTDGNVGDILREHPPLDRTATSELARLLFAQDKLSPMEDGNLCFTCPPDDELVIGCFPKVSILAAKEFGIDYPSQLPAAFVSHGGTGAVYLHAMHSVVDWVAFAHWIDGRLIRSLSLSPDHGVLEDIGERLPFEEPYWAGQHPASYDDLDGYPFPFHPLDLGEAALASFFGYQLEGPTERCLFDPESIPLVRYKRSRSRWKFW